MVKPIRSPFRVGNNLDNELDEATASIQLVEHTQGFLVNRLTTVQRDAIVAPANGLLIFNTDNKEFEFFDGNSLTWQPLYSGVSVGVPFVPTTGGAITGSLTISTPLGTASGGTGVTTYAALITAMGGTTVGTNVFKAADQATARQVIGVGSVGDPLFTASSQSAARTTLGLGTLSVQNSTSVAISGGTIDGVTLGSIGAVNGTITNLTVSGTFTLSTPLGITSGGTGAASASAALSAFGIGMLTSSSTTLGINALTANIDTTYDLHIDTDTSAGRGILIQKASTSTNSPHLDFKKSRGTTTTPTIVVSGDNVGTLSFATYDGAAYQPSASMVVTADNTVSAGNVPTRITLSTFTSGGALTERFRIDNAGNITMGAAPAAQSLKVAPTASSVNYIQISGGAASSAPVIAAVGSDTNIDITLTPQGTGVFNFNTGQHGTTVGAAGGASALPAAPLGYLSVKIAGVSAKIAYWNP